MFLLGIDPLCPRKLGHRLLLNPDPHGTATAQRLSDVFVYIAGNFATVETVGSNDDCTYMIVADMAQVGVGRRQRWRSPYSPHRQVCARWRTVL